MSDKIKRIWLEYQDKFGQTDHIEPVYGVRKIEAPGFTYDRVWLEHQNKRGVKYITRVTPDDINHRFHFDDEETKALWNFIKTLRNLQYFRGKALTFNDYMDGVQVHVQEAS
jgi:hypothetical protein